MNLKVVQQPPLFFIAGNSTVNALRLGRFQIYQDAEEDCYGDGAPGGAGRLFSSPLCSRCSIAFSNSFW